MPAEYLLEKEYVKEDLVCLDRLYSGATEGWVRIVRDIFDNADASSQVKEGAVSKF
jgi:hypothetical protein